MTRTMGPAMLLACALSLPLCAAQGASERHPRGLQEASAAKTALAEDDECQSDGSGEGSQCGLNALQLRGEKAAQLAAAEDPAGGASRGPWGARGALLGEGFKFDPDLETDSQRHHHHHHQQGSCRHYKCGEYHHHYTCQCTEECAQYENCCHDYVAACVGGGSPVDDFAPSPTPWMPVAPVAPVMPSGPAAPLPAGLPYGHPSSSVSYPKYPGFTLWLAEEFDTPINLDSDPIWTWSDGGLSEGQVRFVKNAISFGGGKMFITAGRSSGYQGQSCSHAEKGQVSQKPLTSGEIRTKHNWFRYGRYEVRMKAPEVQSGDPGVDGNFISTMFVYRDAKFKHWREIDIEVTGDSPGAITTNMLSADHTSAWRASIQESVHGHQHGINARAQFHTYAFEWLPDRITWYVDGRKIREQSGGHLPIPDKSGKIMMNLWIFGPQYAFGGKEGHNNRYPMHNEYDYFRFYKWDGDKNYPCRGMSASCLSSDDNYLTGNNPCDGIPQMGTLNGKPPCSATCR